MTANPARLGAIRAIQANEAPATFFNGADDAPASFGENVFSLTVMAKRLPKAIYKSVAATSRTVSGSTRPSPTSSPRR